jgi:hypothetical protein
LIYKQPLFQLIELTLSSSETSILWKVKIVCRGRLALCSTLARMYVRENKLSTTLTAVFSLALDSRIEHYYLKQWYR